MGVNEYKLLFSFFLENVEDLIISVLKAGVKKGFEEFCRLEEEMLQRNKNALKLHATYTLPHQHANLQELEQRLSEELQEVVRQIQGDDSADTKYDSTKLKNLSKNYMDYLAKK